MYNISFHVPLLSSEYTPGNAFRIFSKNHKIVFLVENHIIFFDPHVHSSFFFGFPIKITFRHQTSRVLIGWRDVSLVAREYWRETEWRHCNECVTN